MVMKRQIERPRERSRTREAEQALGVVSDIPWLEGLMRATPRAPLIQPCGGRVEESPSVETTDRVLTAGAPIEGSERQRTRPGLGTRA